MYDEFMMILCNHNFDFHFICVDQHTLQTLIDKRNGSGNTKDENIGSSNRKKSRVRHRKKGGCVRQGNKSVRKEMSSKELKTEITVKKGCWK